MRKNHSLKLSVLIVVVLAAITAVPVLAAPPLNVHIVADEVIAGPGSFTASGPAVDDGLLCAAGTTSDLSVVTSGPPLGALRILRVHKQFTCDDASGTFVLKLIVRLDTTTGYTTARWNVVSGTDDYASLHGSGSLVGVPVDVGISIIDYYDGRVH